MVVRDGIVPAIEAIDVRKDFGHVRALMGASLSVMPGEIVGIVGDNGAGKSTLMKVISGAISPDSGEVRIAGNAVPSISVREAHARGVQTVYQDLALAPDLTIQENIFLGQEVLTNGVGRFFRVVARRQMSDDAYRAVRALGVNLPSAAIRVSDLSGGQRQSVAIARAMMWATSAILLDEPTAALGARQTEIVLQSVRAAAASGLAVVVVSHDMPRILQLAHRIVIMRHGTVVAELQAGQADIPTVVSIMLGSRVDSNDR